MKVVLAEKPPVARDLDLSVAMNDGHANTDLHSGLLPSLRSR